MKRNPQFRPKQQAGFFTRRLWKCSVMGLLLLLPILGIVSCISLVPVVFSPQTPIPGNPDKSNGINVAIRIKNQGTYSVYCESKLPEFALNGANILCENLTAIEENRLMAELGSIKIIYSKYKETDKVSKKIQLFLLHAENGDEIRLTFRDFPTGFFDSNKLHIIREHPKLGTLSSDKPFYCKPPESLLVFPETPKANAIRQGLIQAASEHIREHKLQLTPESNLELRGDTATIEIKEERMDEHTTRSFPVPSKTPKTKIKVDTHYWWTWESGKNEEEVVR